MKTIVISLGGSVIIPDEVDTAFLQKFKNVVMKFRKNYKIILVTGGGSIARTYIRALNKKNAKIQSLMGISITRLNAKFLYNLFNLKFYTLPHTLKEVKSLVKRNPIVICGALRYEPEQTSDGTAAEIARYLKADFFINITNVDGLYTKDPKLNGARLIKKISTERFYKITKKIKFHAGQHFVLDANAAKIIIEEKIPTYIIGRNLNNLERILSGKNFRGTLLFPS